MNDGFRFSIGNGLFAIVDLADESIARAYNWHAARNQGGMAYVCRWICGNGTARRARLHRDLMGAKDGEIVDHINGDTLDNRRGNLRITDAAGNSRNAGRRRKNTTSVYKGVIPSQRPSMPWRSNIISGGKRYCLGNFPTQEAAARAYDAKALELHGEFARTNVHLGLLSPL